MPRAALEKAGPWIVVVTMVVGWEVACWAFRVPAFILPRPSHSTKGLIEWIGPIWFHAEQALISTLLGFLISIVIGVLLGIAVGSSRLAYRSFYPVLVGFNSVPKVAIVPVLVVWFGIGAVPAVLTAFL